jgi:hypothetical protein
MLQAGRSWVEIPMRSLDFSIDLIFQPRYGPGDSTTSNVNEYQEYSWGVKGSQHVRLTTPLPSVSWLSRKCGNPDISQPYGPSQPVTGIHYLFFFNILLHSVTAWVLLSHMWILEISRFESTSLIDSKVALLDAPMHLTKRKSLFPLFTISTCQCNLTVSFLLLFCF